MVDNFLETQQPVGKTREEIVALLGEPDPLLYMKDQGVDMIYQLGVQRRGMPVDSEWLAFTLNESEVVIEVHVFTD